MHASTGRRTTDVYAIDPEWAEIVRWGGLALFIAGAALVVFILGVGISQQELPVPPEEVLDDPLVPTLLFVVAAFGELMLMPAGLALYGALKGGGRATMLMAAAFWLLATPLFLASRGPILSLAKLSDSYQDATSESIRDAYVVSAESAIEIQNMYSTMAIIALAVATVLVGVAMLRGGFGRRLGYLVVVAGVLTFFAPFAVQLGAPEAIALVGLVLSAIWQTYVGLRLFRLGSSTLLGPAHGRSTA